MQKVPGNKHLMPGLAIGLVLVASVFLFYGDPYSYRLRSIAELWNLGHVVYFALLTYLLGHWARLQQWPAWKQMLVLLGLAFVLGVFIEWLQYGAQRSPDWLDVSRDILGCLLVLAFYSRLLADFACLWRSLLKLLSVLLLLLHLVPLAVALVDESIARLQFPLLSNFETPFELNRWEGEADRHITQLDPERDEKQMRIDLTTARFSGVSLVYLPSDWRGYAYVSARFYQPSPEPLGFNVRIHDKQHETGLRRQQFDDRFTQNFELQPGWNTLHISLAEVENAPAGRRMEMAKIRDISFFSADLAEAKTLYLDKLYLAH